MALHAKSRRKDRKCRIVLDAGEALFACGGYDFAVTNESRGRIVVMS
jgi:hypothetical protein